MLALHHGSSANLEIEPNLWAGFGLVRGGAGTALGRQPRARSPRKIKAYAALGIDEFVLSGVPHLEEAYWFAEGVLPLLRKEGLWRHPRGEAAGAGSSHHDIPFSPAATREPVAAAPAELAMSSASQHLSATRAHHRLRRRGCRGCARGRRAASRPKLRRATASAASPSRKWISPSGARTARPDRAAQPRRRGRLRRDARPGLPHPRRRRPRRRPAAAKSLRCPHRHPRGRHRGAKTVLLRRGAGRGAVSATPGRSAASSSALDLKTRLRRSGADYVLEGTKHYTTGALFAHWLPVAAIDDEQRLVLAYVPRSAAGVEVLDDWNAHGQRATYSGTAHFRAVSRCPRRTSSPTGGCSSGPRPSTPSRSSCMRPSTWASPKTPLRTPPRPCVRANVPRLGAPVSLPNEDPLPASAIRPALCQIPRRRGPDPARRLARLMLAGSASVDPESAAKVAVLVGEAKAYAEDASVEIASELFALLGTSASDESLNLDRHWRNARVHTVHDANQWRYHAAGNWFLNGMPPGKPVRCQNREPVVGVLAMPDSEKHPPHRARRARRRGVLSRRRGLGCAVRDMTASRCRQRAQQNPAFRGPRPRRRRGPRPAFAVVLKARCRLVQESLLVRGPTPRLMWPAAISTASSASAARASPRCFAPSISWKNRTPTRKRASRWADRR